METPSRKKAAAKSPSSSSSSSSEEEKQLSLHETRSALQALRDLLNNLPRQEDITIDFDLPYGIPTNDLHARDQTMKELEQKAKRALLAALKIEIRAQAAAAASRSASLVNQEEIRGLLSKLAPDVYWCS